MIFTLFPPGYNVWYVLSFPASLIPLALWTSYPLKQIISCPQHVGNMQLRTVCNLPTAVQAHIVVQGRYPMLFAPGRWNCPDSHGALRMGVEVNRNAVHIDATLPPLPLHHHAKDYLNLMSQLQWKRRFQEAYSDRGFFFSKRKGGGGGSCSTF